MQDYFNGLGVTIHDVYATEIALQSIDIKDGKFSAIVMYNAQDHFGLDKNDIMRREFHYIRFFRIWFVLQHWEQFGFKPFFTNFKAEIEISGIKQ
ncbi:DUF3289 family protein [Paramixta manurensis]|uniref:DUF3289 family protein n=1 Tax=Paramixta manurensis TaxID=2740817 RepID=UPI0033966AF3